MKKLAAALALILATLAVAPAAHAATRPTSPIVAKGGTCPTVLHIPQKVKVLKCVTGTVAVWRWQATPVPGWVLDFTV